MSVEGNAPIISLTFRKSDGSVRTARFIFDSGGGAIILDEELATDIGLKPEGAVITDEGQQYKSVEVPVASIGGMPLDLRTSNAFVHLGVASFTNRDKVEGLLPGKALEHYQVILDYPRQELSIAAPAASRTGESDCLARTLRRAYTRESMQALMEQVTAFYSTLEPRSL